MAERGTKPTPEAERKRRYRAQRALREQGLQLLLVPVDMRAIEAALGLLPAPTAEERAEQIEGLLLLLTLPDVSAVLRRALEEIYRRHFAEPERCPEWDIDRLLSKTGGADS